MNFLPAWMLALKADDAAESRVGKAVADSTTAGTLSSWGRARADTGLLREPAEMRRA